MGVVYKRTRITPEQTALLHRFFEIEPLPDLPERMALAHELGLTLRSVQVWFQNRRQRARPHPTYSIATALEETAGSSSALEQMVGSAATSEPVAADASAMASEGAESSSAAAPVQGLDALLAAISSPSVDTSSGSQSGAPRKDDSWVPVR